MHKLLLPLAPVLLCYALLLIIIRKRKNMFKWKWIKIRDQTLEQCQNWENGCFSPEELNCLAGNSKHLWTVAML